ncbi:MAG TPA: tetratricopeptide repeat protein [Nostocaceae cyanobacterium]|nr:tetratricopeptide repeat protein [Nostocaceae cyanobacterium]
MAKRPLTYGDVTQARVKRLFARLLEYANDEIEERYEIRVHWENDQQVDIQTNLIALAALTGLKKGIIGEALIGYLDKFLGILEDLRGGKTKGSEDWHFLLKLWCPKNQQDKNLQQFDIEWQKRRNAKPGVQRTQKPQPKITRLDNLPESGVIDFVGRGEELEKLHELLQQNQRVAIAAIAGMGGIGKTELALQYALQHRATYPSGICWLSSKAGEVGEQITNLARILHKLNPPDDFGLQQRVQFCWRLWPGKENVLLVVDDISDYREVKDYLQFPSPRFKVLITTREKLQLEGQLDLNVLKPLAAMKLLKTKTLVGEERVKREPWTARKLCKWLGYLPLGLELVGRYLAVDEDFSLGEMLEALEQEGLENPALVDEPGEMTAERGVAAAFELSWRKLSENAQILGCLLSLFALAPIPWELVEAVDIAKGKIWKTGRHDLLKLHLVQRQSEGIYQLHPLLRRFFQDKLTELSQGEELKRAFCKVMVGVAEEIPETITLKEVAEISPKRPHIAEVAENLIEYVSDDDLIYLFQSNAQFYRDQGLYTQALPWCQQCLEATRHYLGEEHPHFATSLNNLAALYYFQGRYSEAEPLYLQSLELKRCLLGDKHPDFADSLNNLALLYYFQGRYSEAEPLYLQALELYHRFLGDKHLHFATILNNLAMLYRSQGRYGEAEIIYQQALELCRHFLGEKHPHFAQTLNNLALLYYSQGRYSEAEPLYLQALELRRCLLGEKHPDFTQSLNNLAKFYDSQGRYSEAEPLYLQALELNRRLLGEEHPDFAHSLDDLILLYYSQGRYIEAEPLYLQALELKRRLLGEEHPDFIYRLNTLAFLYHSQGRYREAEPLYLRVLKLKRCLLGEEHPDFAQNMNDLAEIYYSQGRFNEAETLLQQALELRRRLLGEEHPDFATSLNNLAGLYDSQGRFNEAEVLYLQALELRRSLLGEEDPDFAISLNNLAFLYSSQGRYGEAELLFQQAVEICEKSLGENHPKTIIFCKNLAKLRAQMAAES